MTIGGLGENHKGTQSVFGPIYDFVFFFLWKEILTIQTVYQYKMSQYKMSKNKKNKPP